MHAIVPAAGERAGDVLRVAAAVIEARLTPVVVWQGPLSARTAEQVTAYGPLVYYDRPLGKGGAVQLALSRLGAVDCLVVDGDLTDPDSAVFSALAAAVRVGCWARTVHTAAGRIGRGLPDVLDRAGLPWPRELAAGGLLAPMQGYAARDVPTLLAAPAGYGFDLSVALALHVEGRPLRAVAAGDRAHRPGDERHLQAIAADIAAVIGEQAAWSA